MKKQLLTAVLLSCSGISFSSHAATLAQSAYVSAKLGASSIGSYSSKADFTYTPTSTSPFTSDSDSVKLSKDHQTAFTGNIAYGVNFLPAYNVPIRLEFEYAYHDKVNLNSTVTGAPALTISGINITEMKNKNNVTSQTFMFNGYYDFINHSKFTPYLSVGLGSAYTKFETAAEIASSTTTIENNNASDKSSHFAWAVGAGVSYAINPNLSLDLSYRYLNMGESKNTLHYINHATSDTVDIENKIKVDAQDLTFGLRYSF